MAEQMYRWAIHPATMVRELFQAEPDPWQEDVLEDFPRCKRQSMVACKGPGKTAVLAWIILNFILTRDHPNIMVTSSSEDNLNDGLWKELAKWMGRAPIFQESFELTKTRLFHKADPDNWFCSKRTWSRSADAQTQSNTLAGFHADNVMAVIDEVSGVPTGVTSSAEAIMSSGVEQHFVIAGNPEKLEGLLYESTTSLKHLWEVYHITNDPDDPKRSTRASIEYARYMIGTHGRDSDFTRINVLGQFPLHSINTLIGPEEIRDAQRRNWRETEIANFPKLLGVDVALYGDDAQVMFPRQGLVAYNPTEWRGLDSIAGAGNIARKIVEWGADATFVDNTGGYGAGWVDQLRLLGHSPIPVTFSTEPADRRFYNKRAEMYWNAVQWIRGGGQLPDCPPMAKALTSTCYSERNDRLILEPKEDIKLKIGHSPDHADAFVMTFAQPVAARRTYHAAVGFAPQMYRQPRNHQINYDPFAECFAGVQSNPHRGSMR